MAFPGPLSGVVAQNGKYLNLFAPLRAGHAYTMAGTLQNCENSQN